MNETQLVNMKVRVHTVCDFVTSQPWDASRFQIIRYQPSKTWRSHRPNVQRAAERTVKLSCLWYCQTLRVDVLLLWKLVVRSAQSWTTNTDVPKRGAELHVSPSSVGAAVAARHRLMKWRLRRRLRIKVRGDRHQQNQSRSSKNPITSCSLQHNYIIHILICC